MAGSGDTGSARPSFRGDVDGLRAIAILLVVLFHAHAWWPGGFVGVDVFFVISGFLITRNLLAESDSGQRVHLLTFWAKRIRRLLPAMALVVVTTMVAALFVAPPLVWKGMIKDAGASMLYVSNILFAGQNTDYFADSSEDSAFLHTWSLGVEEQFYLLWPLLFFGVWWAVRRRQELRRPLLVGIFTIGAIASLAIAVWWTAARPRWGFFLLPSRAWEFALAGLLAMWRPPVRLRSTPVAAVSAVVGLGLIVVAGATFSGVMAYPGLWALVPVSGTLLVILAGTLTESNPVSSLLALPPFQWLGRVSYSWYLWHWPAIVLAVGWTGSNTAAVRGAAVLATLPVAAIAYSRFENPVRHARWLSASNGRTYAFAAVVTVFVVGGLAAYFVHASSTLDRSPQAELVELRARYEQYRSGLPCVEERTVGNSTLCELGDPDGSDTIMLIGDSHAGHWAEAFGHVAKERGDSMVLYWAQGCPAIDIRVSRSDGSVRPACQAMNDDLEASLDEVEPDVVVLSSSHGYPQGGLRKGELEGLAAWEAALEERIQVLQTRGVEVGLIDDNPRFAMNPRYCLSLHGAHSDRCQIEIADVAVEWHEFSEVQRRVAEREQVATFSINDRICPDGICKASVDDVSVFADAHHLSYPFTMLQADRIDAFFDELLSVPTRS